MSSDQREIVEKALTLVNVAYVQIHDALDYADLSDVDAATLIGTAYADLGNAREILKLAGAARLNSEMQG
jgi:hypothetical protein